LLAGILARTHAHSLLRFRRDASDRRQGCGVCLRESPRRHRGWRRGSRPPDRVFDPTNMEAGRDIPSGAENKDLARTRAIARWPARADLFARKCDIDRAEACLIALGGLRREARNV
jgi:hypothetical protein